MNAGLARTPTDRRVLVGVDGSDGSKDALRWAARLAEQEGAVLSVVATWDFPDAFSWDGGPVPYSPKEDIENCLAATLDEVFGSRHPARMATGVLRGDAARILVDLSKDALLLVVGSRGHGQLAGLVLGSVSAKVAGHSACSVLVVHGPPPDR